MPALLASGSPFPRRAPAGARDGAPAALRGVVTKVYFAKPGWSAAHVAPHDGSAGVRVAGAFYAREGEHISLVGKWKHQEPYGLSIVVESASYELPAETDGLAAYIAKNPAFAGFGPKKAARLAAFVAEHHGGDLSRALVDADPRALARACGVTTEKLAALAAEWRSREDTNAAATYLAAYDLTSHQIQTLLDSHGPTVVGILKDDPYQLLGLVDGFGFKRLDAIARKMGTPKDHPSRARHGLVHCVREAAERMGHTLVDEEDLLSAALQLLELDTIEQRDELPGHLSDVVDEGRLFVGPSVEGRTGYALPALREAEKVIACALTAGAPYVLGVGAAYAASLVQEYGPELNEQQRLAVLTALVAPFSVVTGPAGSGKSHLMSTLVRICEALEVRVTMCAPTGRAAQRMEEATGGKASTIHRLLQYRGKVFIRTEPLPAGVLLVDEISMCGSALLAELLRRVDATRTVVVLVGDHHQLPPVDAGSPLRDLLRTGAVPITKLTQVVRQAGELKMNCSLILQGQVAPSQDRRRKPDSPSDWFVIGHVKEPEDLAALVAELVTIMIPGRLGYDPIADVQVLSPVHKGPVGCHALNLLLQRALQQKVYGVDVPPPEPPTAAAFYAGDKVIHRRNDYTANVMNGTQGRVRWAGRRAAVVAYDGRSVLYTHDGAPLKDEDRFRIPEEIQALVEGWLFPASLRDLHLAYALTVHSSQGGQYPCVLMVCHKGHAIMHRRELLYTGVTRAQRCAIIAGDWWAINGCAARDTSEARRTWLPLLLDYQP